MRRAASLPALLLAAALTPATATWAAEPPADLGSLAPGVIHSGMAALSDPSQTYELYLPPGFDRERPWPLLLVFDPRSRGRLAAEIFQPAAAELGWIVASSNDTMSDGPWEPNIRAVNAIFPDLVRRLPIDPRRIYATGFSGGAMLAWIVGVRTGQLAGVISVGGRPVEGLEKDPPGFALWATAGHTDFNHGPTAELDALATRAGVPHRLEYFDGAHTWFPSTEARRALGWFEVLAMRDGRRPRSDELVAAELAADLEGARELERGGRPLDAVRRLRALVASYGGLAEIEPLAREADRIERGAAARQAEKDARWAARFEEQGRRRIAETVALLRADEALPQPSKLRGALGLDQLLALRAEGGARGEAAGRVLSSVAAQFGFYLMRDLFATGDFPRAVAALSLAVEASPGSPFAWYNLACAQARAGNRRAALDSLERALELGLPRAEQIESDSDLAGLRDEPRFTELVARARSARNP